MPSPEYRPLAVVAVPSTATAKPPGPCKRLHILKVILVVGFVLTLLNLNYRFDMKLDKISFLRSNFTQPAQTPSSASSPPSMNFGPKRLRTNSELKQFLRSNNTSSSTREPDGDGAVQNSHQHATADGDQSQPRHVDSMKQEPRTRKTIFSNKTLNLLDNQPLLSSSPAINLGTNAVPSNQSVPDHPSSVPQKSNLQVVQNNVNETRNATKESHADEKIEEPWTTNPENEQTVTTSFPANTTSENNLEDDDERLHLKTDDSANFPNGSHPRFTGYIQTTTTRSVTFLSKLMTKLGINACPESPPDLHGPLEVNLTKDTIAEVETRLRPYLLPGGWFRPIECNAKDRVAIIIPFRDREEHLPILLKNLHPMLMRQQVNYGIFVVEETKADPFNRASLMNVGFLEANKMDNWDCFIFHDVDLIPLDDRNLYRCPEQPRHMSVAIDVFDFKLPYFTIFGGVSALTKQQFHSVNGFSNLFWGWGGEDDDMSNRIRFMGYHISRYPMNIARYTMLSHKKAQPNPKRYEKLSNGLKRYENDGLNSVKYQLVDNKKFPLFTWLLVKLQPELIAGKPNAETDEHPFLKYFILLLLATLLLCIFKVLLF